MLTLLRLIRLMLRPSLDTMVFAQIFWIGRIALTSLRFLHSLPHLIGQIMADFLPGRWTREESFARRNQCAYGALELRRI